LPTPTTGNKDLVQTKKMMDAYAGGEEEGEEGDEKLRIMDGYRLYQRRWVMLVLFGLLSLTNALAWISFAPIAYHTGTPPPPLLCPLLRDYARASSSHDTQQPSSTGCGSTG
jgi:hypothetical protein